MTRDTWHVTPYTRHLTRDMWHLTCDRCLEDLEEKERLINYGGICRTAPATPGLLNIQKSNQSLYYLWQNVTFTSYLHVTITSYYMHVHLRVENRWILSGGEDTWRIVTNWATLSSWRRRKTRRASPIGSRLSNTRQNPPIGDPPVIITVTVEAIIQFKDNFWLRMS